MALRSHVLYRKLFLLLIQYINTLNLICLLLMPKLSFKGVGDDISALRIILFDTPIL